MLTTSLTLLDKLRQPEDPVAWTRFVKLYAPLLLHWARRQGFQPADAADLTQDVLLKMFRLLAGYVRGSGQTFRGWLFRIIVNQARDFRRRRATRALPQSDELPDPEADSPIAEMDETEYRQLLVRRGMELIRSDFNNSTWSAFEEVMQKGRPPSEVAKQLGISENAVFMARHRILKRLREELDGMLE